MVSLSVLLLFIYLLLFFFMYSWCMSCLLVGTFVGTNAGEFELGNNVVS